MRPLLTAWPGTGLRAIAFFLSAARSIFWRGPWHHTYPSQSKLAQRNLKRAVVAGPAVSRSRASAAKPRLAPREIWPLDSEFLFGTATLMAIRQAICLCSIPSANASLLTRSQRYGASRLAKAGLYAIGENWPAKLPLPTRGSQRGKRNEPTRADRTASGARCNRIAEWQPHDLAAAFVLAHENTPSLRRVRVGDARLSDLAFRRHRRVPCEHPSRGKPSRHSLRSRGGNPMACTIGNALTECGRSLRAPLVSAAALHFLL